MAVKKLPSGKWQAQVFPEGRDGRRIRRLFTTKGEAMAFERHLLSADKPWQNEAEEQEERRLSDLVERWYGLHGQSLTDGTSRLSKLNHLVNALDNPVATEFTAKDFASYRERRLAGDETTRPVTPTTVNREHAYLRAVFNELKRLGEWDGANPMDGIRTYKVSESELTFLYQKEIVRLRAPFFLFLSLSAIYVLSTPAVTTSAAEPVKSASSLQQGKQLPCTRKPHLFESY